MKRDSPPLQLDLTESITDVPQANNIALFIEMMEALRTGEQALSHLAELLDVDERTARYYTDFGRWLKFLRHVDDSRVGLTTEGMAFVDSKPARGRLFSAALFERPLVQTVQQVKREHFADVDEPESTRQACLFAVERLTRLAPATAQRRAGALASMLRWAHRPRDLDWTTGRPQEHRFTPFNFVGQSFVTAFAAREFGTERTMFIGFPRQVMLFAVGRGADLKPSHWEQASYEVKGGQARWFGSIPINETTLAVARRQGPDLRRLLISCNPYIAILTNLLIPVATAGSPPHGPVRLTRDMYGLRVWHRDRELGSPIQTVAVMAATLNLICVETVPHLQGQSDDEILRPGSDDELIEVLLHTGILRPVETSLMPSPGLVNELLHPVGDGPTLWERCAALQKALTEALRRPA
jgi:hypothetical protein